MSARFFQIAFIFSVLFSIALRSSLSFALDSETDSARKSRYLKMKTVVPIQDLIRTFEKNWKNKEEYFNPQGICNNFASSYYIILEPDYGHNYDSVSNLFPVQITGYSKISYKDFYSPVVRAALACGSFLGSPRIGYSFDWYKKTMPYAFKNYDPVQAGKLGLENLRIAEKIAYEALKKASNSKELNSSLAHLVDIEVWKPEGKQRADIPELWEKLRTFAKAGVLNEGFLPPCDWMSPFYSNYFDSWVPMLNSIPHDILVQFSPLIQSRAGNQCFFRLIQRNKFSPDSLQKTIFSNHFLNLMGKLIKNPNREKEYGEFGIHYVMENLHALLEKFDLFEDRTYITSLHQLWPEIKKELGDENRGRGILYLIVAVYLKSNHFMEEPFRSDIVGGGFMWQANTDQYAKLALTLTAKEREEEIERTIRNISYAENPSSKDSILRLQSLVISKQDLQFLISKLINEIDQVGNISLGNMADYDTRQQVRKLEQLNTSLARWRLLIGNLVHSLSAHDELFPYREIYSRELKSSLDFFENTLKDETIKLNPLSYPVKISFYGLLTSLQDPSIGDLQDQEADGLLRLRKLVNQTKELHSKKLERIVELVYQSNILEQWLEFLLTRSSLSLNNLENVSRVLRDGKYEINYALIRTIEMIAQSNLYSAEINEAFKKFDQNAGSDQYFTLRKYCMYLWDFDQVGCTQRIERYLPILSSLGYNIPPLGTKSN